jgi:hypothetical protein
MYAVLLQKVREYGRARLGEDMQVDCWEFERRKRSFNLISEVRFAYKIRHPDYSTETVCICIILPYFDCFLTKNGIHMSLLKLDSSPVEL